LPNDGHARTAIAWKDFEEILADQPAETSGAFIVTHESVKSEIDGLGLWVKEQMDTLNASDLLSVLRSVGKLFVAGADGIGLASAFPNTSTVESNFPLLGWKRTAVERSEWFSLEGILHTKQ
jgi:hypothetical protein